MKIKKLNESKISFTLFKPDEQLNRILNEDASYEWKPNTSFKHIKDIYNKVKNNNYKYVNNEREEFMAAVKKADNKGYKPEECRQIKDWHREIWQKNRKINERYNKSNVNEAFNVDAVQKRIARVDEFDNGHVIHNDWTRMSSQEAEEKARQMSIENPDKVYYVKYDNIMEPCSDIKWKNGKQLTEDVPMEYIDPNILKALADEDEYYNKQRERRIHNFKLLHKIFDSHGYRDSEERWADKVFDIFRDAEKITVVDDAAKVPSKTKDGQKVKYIFSTPDAEVDVHMDVYGDYVWVVTKDSINESFEINDEFWTKEELLDFADDVCAHINETFNNSYNISEVYLTNGVIELTVVDDEGNEFSTKYKVDMRKVKRPSHIDRFVLPVAADLIQQIKDFDNNLSEDLSGKYSNKFKALVNAYEDDSEVLLLILKEMIRYCKEDDLKDLWIEKEYDKLVNPNDIMEEDLTKSLKEKLNLDKDGKALKRMIARLVLDSDEELKDFVMEVTKEVIDERNGKLDEDFEGEPLKGPKEGPESGMSSLINTAIKDEFSTIQLYNDMAITARAEGFEDIANVIDEINTDENTHVGQLQDLLKTISPNATAIDEAEKENISINEAGIESNSPQEWAEHYYDINKLDDFVANSLSDKSLSEDDLISIAKKSSTIEIDDMKRAINSYKKK